MYEEAAKVLKIDYRVSLKNCPTITSSIKTAFNLQYKRKARKIYTKSNFAQNASGKLLDHFRSF